MLTTGTVLEGRYRIIRLLAKGGMGAVYLAMDETLKTNVALKECSFTDDPATNDIMRRAFEREAQLLAKLRYAALPKVSDHFVNNEGQFLVMEFIPGDDLINILGHRGQPFSVDEVFLWADQLLAALEYLHSRKPPIIHRDIKPQNVKLTDEGQIVLLDFGLAKGGERSMHGFTPDYAPPEQIGKTGTDPRSDLYSLGATLYHLLTGEKPVDALTRMTKLTTGDADPLPPANELNPHVPSSFAEVLEKAMAIKPSDRPASAAEMRREIDKIIKCLPPENDGGNPPQPENDDPSTIIENPTTLQRVQSSLKFIAAKLKTIALWKRIAIAVTAIAAVVVVVMMIVPTGNQSLPPTGPTFEFETAIVDSNGNIKERRKGQARQLVEDLGGGVTIEMVEIPAGTFLMGSPETEAQRDSNEEPRHQVSMRSFYIGKYEVTQAQWKAVAGLLKVNRDLNLDPSDFKGDSKPVERVSWEDAIEFCNRLNRAKGKEYRLPTEAEWEYACRAGTTTPFAFGETVTPEIANYDGRSPYESAPKGEYRGQTTEVGVLGLANGFGLYDMHGNLKEWCMDRWHNSYNGAPTDGRAWEIGGDNNRLVRGGSWKDTGRFCRSTLRHFFRPVVRLNHLGFRVVLVMRTL